MSFYSKLYKALLPTLIILNTIYSIGLSLEVYSSSNIWNIVLEEEPAIDVSLIIKMLNDAYSWIRYNGLDIAVPCSGSSYDVVIAPYLGFGTGFIYPDIYYYDPSTREARYCVEYILLDFTNYSYISNYSEEYITTLAIHTVIHELFHGVQLRYLQYYDPDVHEGITWIIESTAVAATYIYSRENNYYIDLFIADTLYYILSRGIDVYFASRLYSMDPVEISKVYGYDKPYVYYYSPLFIWIFDRYGIDIIKDLLSEYDPSNSRLLLDLMSTFFIDIAINGFSYVAGNRTVTIHPSPNVADGLSISLTLEPRSSEYIVFNITDGIYKIDTSGNAEALIINLDSGTISTASESIVKSGDRYMIVVLSIDKPSSISIDLKRINRFEYDKLSLNLVESIKLDDQGRRLITLSIYNPNSIDINGTLIIQVKTLDEVPIYSLALNISITSKSYIKYSIILDLEDEKYIAKVFIVREISDMRLVSNILEFRI